MNERIKELSRTAEREVQISLGERWTTVGRAEFMRLYNQKFAELIVLECCQKLEDDGMVEVAMEMKQHFGVEE